MQPLEIQQIQDKLSILNGWSLVNNEITKMFTAGSFHAAIGFVVQIALLAEAADHHPELCIAYNKVSVKLSTHTANGITELDFTLAEKIEKVFSTTHQ